ncbi:MAG: hypothetical protein ACRELF_05710, partial [Gemmataceae bacterium]
MAIVTGQTGIGLPAYDIVLSVNASSGIITLESPVTMNSGGQQTVDFSNDNGGSVVRDGETAPVCYNRATWNYNPREWGAHGHGSTDDTVPLQSWLNADQPHIGDIGNYMITSPLTCPANVNIQAPANLTGGHPLGGSGTPQFEILADSATGAFTGTTLMTALNYCRLSGVALNAQNVPDLDDVDIAGTHVGIDGHTLLENAGKYAVNCPGGGATQVDGLQVKDTQVFQAYDDGIHLPGGCANVRLIGDVIQSNGQDGTGSGVYFHGDDLSLEGG